MRGNTYSSYTLILSCEVGYALDCIVFIDHPLWAVCAME